MKEHVADVLVFGGALALIAGLWLMAGWGGAAMSVGVLMLSAGILEARRKSGQGGTRGP